MNGMDIQSSNYINFVVIVNNMKKVNYILKYNMCRKFYFSQIF